MTADRDRRAPEGPRSTTRRRFLTSAAAGAAGVAALSGRAGAQTDPAPVSKFATTVGDGTSKTIEVPHGLGTTDVVVEVAETGGGREIDCEVSHDDATKVTLRFTFPPAPNSLRVTVVG